ncbi:OLC1v1007242C1 [Oldenlandia corymbosa var. corymbosa]|uniref:OLC1v1007242C1 n=1 Tax=Oldenlandia corymbosa var. corymbosa TaxID=529605 RepID=A0AAV1DL80_OLDCO|nr:OLC1v1007242C1 [Oldenlandia corymbosa var. corymbosa]
MMKKRGRVSTEAELPLVEITPAAAVNAPAEFVTAPGKGVGIPPYMGEFWRNCHYCKKFIRDNEEVFMYRDFCGFCSTVCRDIQISIDNNQELLRAQASGNQQQKRGNEFKRQHV